MLHPPPPRLHQAHAAKLKKHIGLSSRKWRQRSTKFISCAVSSPSTKEFIFSGPSPAPAKGLHDNQPLLIQGVLLSNLAEECNIDQITPLLCSWLIVLSRYIMVSSAHSS